MADLLDALCARLSTAIDAQGRAHTDCPFCAAEARTHSGGARYHFYLYDLRGSRGAVCWSCGWRGSLSALAKELDVQGEDTRPPRPMPTAPTPPWAAPGALRNYARWVSHPERQRQIVTAWRRYKPLSEVTIARELLGYGKLSLWSEERGEWYLMHHPRLLLPLIVEGRIVGMRGRAIERGDNGPKWLTASHSQPALLGLDQVGEGSAVIWCENLVDRLMAQERNPGAVVVASGGLTWRPEWIGTMRRRNPRHVLIWFDHDLSGNGSPHHEAEYLRAWQLDIEARRRANPALASRPMPQPPQPRGPLLARELAAAGIPATVYPWPRGTPHKADLGYVLMHEHEERSA